MPAHKEDTAHFHELTEAEQAKSISAQILNIEAAVKHRISNAGDKQKVRNGLEAQIKNLLDRISQMPV